MSDVNIISIHFEFVQVTVGGACSMLRLSVFRVYFLVLHTFCMYFLRCRLLQCRSIAQFIGELEIKVVDFKMNCFVVVQVKTLEELKMLCLEEQFYKGIEAQNRQKLLMTKGEMKKTPSKRYPEVRDLKFFSELLVIFRYSLALTGIRTI